MINLKQIRQINAILTRFPNSTLSNNDTVTEDSTLAENDIPIFYYLNQLLPAHKRYKSYPLSPMVESEMMFDESGLLDLLKNHFNKIKPGCSNKKAYFENAYRDFPTQDDLKNAKGRLFIYLFGKDFGTSLTSVSDYLNLSETEQMKHRRVLRNTMVTNGLTIAFHFNDMSEAKSSTKNDRPKYYAVKDLLKEHRPSISN